MRTDRGLGQAIIEGVLFMTTFATVAARRERSLLSELREAVGTKGRRYAAPRP